MKSVFTLTDIDLHYYSPTAWSTLFKYLLASANWSSVFRCFNILYPILALIPFFHTSLIHLSLELNPIDNTITATRLVNKTIFANVVDSRDLFN